MLIKSLEQLQSDAMAVRNILHFQEKLNSETVEGKFRILSKVLADECSKLNKERVDADSTSAVNRALI